MRKSIVTMLVILALLVLVTGVGYAMWEDTQSTQIAATILPATEDTFRIVSTYCTDAILGRGGYCCIYLENESAVDMSVDVVTATTSRPHTDIQGIYGPGRTAIPGRQVDLGWNYTVYLEGEPGEIVFDVEITCSGD